MPKRIAVNAIILNRDGKRFIVKPGQTVDLSNEELADLKENAPDSFREIVAAQPVSEVVLPPADTASSNETGSGGRGRGRVRGKQKDTGDADNGDNGDNGDADNGNNGEL